MKIVILIIIFKLAKSFWVKLRRLIGDKMGEFTPSLITRNLYISGTFGVTKKNIEERNIKYIINITYDTPYPTFDQVRTDRIEIDDIPTVQISAYFDEYSDIIQSYLVTCLIYDSFYFCIQISVID